MDIFGVLRVTWLPRARLRMPRTEPVESPIPELPPEAPVIPEPPPDVIRGLIGLADDLLNMTERVSESSAHTLQLVQRQVDRLLTGCGVRIVRDDGPVIASRHEVVAVRPAGPHGAEGWIATTVRPGYMHGERLIRPQQVVAYTTEHPAGTEEGNDSEG